MSFALFINHQVALALSTFFLIQLFLPKITTHSLASATDLPRTTPVIYTAIVNVTYRDPVTGEQKYEYNDGWFSSENRIGPGWGWLQLARSGNNRTDGCDPIVNHVEGWWVALIERGRCRFHQKIENAAVHNNASAVIIYNNEHDGQILNMQHSVEDVVAIFLRRNDGLRLVKLMENSTRVFVTITPGSTYFPNVDTPSRTSVIFLFISFIVLAVVSLLWLIFYYVQRFRVHSSLSAERARKNKIARQLNRAAKQVVSKMEQKILKPQDPELSSAELQLCAVCVEEYRANDKIRILPCRHSFHKKCVDQWLHEKRRCPICQLDILKTAGIQIPEEYQNLNNDSMQVEVLGNNNNNSTNVNSSSTSTSNQSPSAEDDNINILNANNLNSINNFLLNNHRNINNNNDDTVFVNVVPGCSAHLYLSGVPYDDEFAVKNDERDATCRSNDSLVDAKAVARAEFKPRLSSDTLSLPSRMTSSSTSSSSSSTFDINEKNVVVHRHYSVNSSSSNNNNNSADPTDLGVDGNDNSINNNNDESSTSVNSHLTALASHCFADDDEVDDDDDDDDDDGTSSSFSPSRYYDCTGEANLNKQQIN